MPSIKTNFLYSSILTTANYIFPLLTFPYVSRVLGVTNVGIVNFVDSVINYFILFSMMGISVVGIREIAKCRNDQAKLNEAFCSLFWLNTLTTTGTLLVLLIVTFLVPQLYAHKEMMFIGGLKLMSNYLLIDWFYRGLEEFKYITVRTLVVKSLYVVSVFLFVREQSDYIIYFLLITLMFSVHAFINLFYARHFVQWQVRKVNVATFLSPFLMLGVYMLLTSMYTSFNVTYLGFVCNETEVGYYATASKLYKILIALFTAFTGVMLPRMSYLLSEGKMDEFKALLNKSVNILFTFSVPLIIYSIIFAPLIIEIIAGSGYEGAILPMRIMMPLMLIIGYEQILIIQTLMPLKKDKAILRNSICGASIGMILNVLLVSHSASVGSSVVWLVSEIVVLCSGQFYVNKYIGFGFPWKLLSKNLLFNIPLALILYDISTMPNMFFSIVLAFIVMFVYLSVLHIIVFPNPVVWEVIRQTSTRLIKQCRHNG